MRLRVRTPRQNQLVQAKMIVQIPGRLMTSKFPSFVDTNEDVSLIRDGRRPNVSLTLRPFVGSYPLRM